MTTRETTQFLPRAVDKGAAGVHRRTASEWAWVIAFGAIQWPWLLRSLSGGPPATRIALLDRLGLPHEALPNLGSWKADAGLLTLVADHILTAKPQILVEFGAGASTLIAARCVQMNGSGHLISFDQHGDFVDATRAWLAEHHIDADIRTAPLSPSPGGWPGLWYDHKALPERIDFLLIDGPPWTIHPFTRGAADSLFDRVVPGGVVMLDDAARPGERIVAARWRRRWPDFTFRLVHKGTKGTLIGTRRA